MWRDLWCIQPDAQTGSLRTRAETKLLHSFAPWSRGGYTHLCNLELLYQHHAMLNFPWSCFCKVDLKKGFDISVIFKLLLVFQHLSLLDCPPAPKDQHPIHCHHVMLLFHYSRARRSICISKTKWRLTKHCKSKYCFLQFRYGEQSSHSTELFTDQHTPSSEKTGLEAKSPQTVEVKKIINAWENCFLRRGPAFANRLWQSKWVKTTI